MPKTNIRWMWPPNPWDTEESNYRCGKNGESRTGSYFLFPSTHCVCARRKSQLKRPLGKESIKNCVVGSFLPQFPLVIVLMYLKENKESNFVTAHTPSFSLVLQTPDRSPATRMCTWSLAQMTLKGLCGQLDWQTHGVTPSMFRPNHVSCCLRDIKPQKVHTTSHNIFPQLWAF